MTTKKKSAKPHVVHHKDGSIWARGMMADGVPTGYWEWFRMDGSKLRSGNFDKGQQVGEWITYDKKGQKYKVTQIKPKPKRRS
jgi:antitoxin component YwqK of YwqJK toxin-antitoxin module